MNKQFMIGMTYVLFFIVNNVNGQIRITRRPSDYRPTSLIPFPIANLSDQEYEFYSFEQIKDLYEDTPEVPIVEKLCDEPLCFPETCIGYGPPPECPENVTSCRSGCATISYCDHIEDSYYYETKFCPIPHRMRLGVFKSTQFPPQETFKRSDRPRRPVRSGTTSPVRPSWSDGPTIPVRPESSSDRTRRPDRSKSMRPMRSWPSGPARN